MKRRIFLFFILWCSFTFAKAQNSYPFQDTSLPVSTRVHDLVSRLTIKEKISQLMNSAPAISRLDIPAYNWWNEGLHGVARAGYATVFPQALSVAASWDQPLLYDIASVISDEARAKYHEYIQLGQHRIYQGLTFWSPNINIFRDPRWGRGHETYGEDPYLTSRMGVNFVEGLQGNDPHYLKVVATAKHFAIHSGPEPARHHFNANPSDRDLWETYLPAFRALVEEAHVYSVMGAYNRVRGEASCASPFLFNILRKDWGFKGYVVSDCGAIEDIWKTHHIVSDASQAAALALKTGCDLNCGNTYKALSQALKEGLITQSTIDTAVSRLFTARFKLGMFDTNKQNPYARIPFSDNDSPAHSELARQAARESIVLLKNENQLLPLSRTIHSIAIIGPSADDVESLLGNYHGTPSHPVTLLQGIKNKVAPQLKIYHAEGSPFAEGIPVFKPVPSVYLSTANGHQGLTGEYFDNLQWKGKPLFKRTDDKVNFCWDIGTPDPRLQMGHYSIRWTGYLTAPHSGLYYFSDWGKPYMTFSIADSLKGGGIHKDGPHIEGKKIFLEKGHRYKVELKYQNFYGDATAGFLWSTPQPDQLAKAVDLASKADVVVLALGLNERMEGEEMNIQLDGFNKGDRTSLKLPAAQRKLMKAIVATGKPVVLVLLNGGPLAVNWAAAHIPAILSAGYPGQEGGNAIADVLFGDYNPAGRLPVTYYQSVGQLPPFDDYSMNNRTYRYFKQQPLFPFGFGLSYTSFSYSAPSYPRKVPMNQPIPVSVRVTNSGSTDGDEVVQLYITDEKASTPRPIRQLEGFRRIHLKKGETKTVKFTLQPDQLSMINRKDERVVEPGWFSFSVGGEQPGFTGAQKATTTMTQTGRFRVSGKVLHLKK